MFCPKCGTKNPDTGKFCRKCGMDMETITDVVTGKLPITSRIKDKKDGKKKVSWESALGKLSMGVAFMVIAFILGVTGAAGGKDWWFWMLIPAFAMIGAGVAQIIRLKEDPGQNVSIDLAVDSRQIASNEQQSLPPKQTEFVSNIPETNYQTGDLVPPSVVENTTRHLELDKEGETVTLPKDKV